MDIIRPGRRVGNTTRLIDSFIQELFDNGYVIVSDHYYGVQKSLDRSKEFVYIMFRRLNIEHGIDCDKSIKKRVIFQTSVKLSWN